MSTANPVAPAAAERPVICLYGCGDAATARARLHATGLDAIAGEADLLVAVRAGGDAAHGELPVEDPADVRGVALRLARWCAEQAAGAPIDRTAVLLDGAALAAGMVLPPAWWPRLRAALRGATDATGAATVVPLGTDPQLDPRPAGRASPGPHAVDALCHAHASPMLFPAQPRALPLAAFNASALAALIAGAWPETSGLPLLPVLATDALCVLAVSGPVREDQPRLPAVASLSARIGWDATPPQVGLDGRPVVLHVLHGWGGGAARFVEDLAAGDDARRHVVLVARAAPGSRATAEWLELQLVPGQPAQWHWPLAAPIVGTALSAPDYAAVLGTVLARWQVAAVVVSSLIGHSLDALRTGLPTAVVCHDHYPLWPVLHADVGDPAADFTPAAIDAAIRGGPLPFEQRDPAYWRALRSGYGEALAAIDALLVAPSQSARQAIERIEPALRARRWARIEHGLAPWPAPAPEPVAAPMPAPGSAPRPLRVLVPGRINGSKGEELLADLFREPLADIEFVLLGSGRSGMRFFGRSGVHVLMDYRREELPRLVARLAPDLALLPSTVPETYSYMLSELWSLGLPVLATRIGSFAERIEDGRTGLLVEPRAAAVAARLRALHVDRTPLATLRRASPPAPPSLPQMAAAWRAALPLPGVAVVAAAVPALVSPDQLRLAAAEREAERLHRSLAAARARQRRDEAELARRSDWGYGLSAQLEERTAWALSLQQQVRERDATIGDERSARARLQQEFDERSRWALSLDAELERMRNSSSWRLTRPLRAARRALAALRARLAFQWQRLHALRHRARRSLAHRGVRGSLSRLRQEFGATPRPPAPQVPAPQPFAPFALPVSEQPRATIVIPAWNHFDATHLCLRAIAGLQERCPFEVIVVDDCSSDETAERLPQVQGLRYLRNASNLGFIGACNAGAQAARGDYLVFLNNDTAVQPGWLDALLDTFDAHGGVGLVGARLVYPDGRLQEAGGIVFRDASGWNYGRFDDPADPRYNFVREADYCSGAAIAIPRALFERFGGFDAYYAPAYYEDTDLAMKVRQAGLRVLYQPASVVVHFEGVSSGTDLGSGVKAHQVTNQQRFLARWSDALASHPAPGTDIAIARQHRARRRILVIDATTPAPDQDSGSLRLVNLMRLLLREGHAVTFFADNRAFVPRYSEALQQMGVEVLWHPWLDDPVGWLAANGNRFDLVFVSRHYIASSYIELVRLHAPQARFVFDTVDLHYLREQRAAELEGRDDLLRAAAQTRARELALVRRADVTLVVSPVEQALLAREVPGARVEVLSNVHAVHGRRRGFAERRDLVFVGGFQHPPNVDAANWLVEEILPRVRAQLPDVRLHLIGSKASEAVQALGQRAGVDFHGYVEDIDPYMDGCRLAVAPLRYGAGVKGKVNLSMAHGQPVVATACAVEGMHAEPGREVLVADDAEGFAREVVRAYRDEVLWTSLSDHGLDNVARHFSFEAALAAVRRLLD